MNAQSLETKLSLEPKTIDALQQLVEANSDSAETLREAAEKVDHVAVENVFRGVAATRTAHARELKSYIRVNDEQPTEDSNLMGQAHRHWIAFRAAINSGDPKVVLIEAERAEDKIKDTYEQLLIETAGSAMNDVLMSQFRQVKKHHDLIQELRKAA